MFSIDVLRKGRITRVHGTMRGGASRIPGDIRGSREPLAPGSAWNQRQEMIWAHNQLQKLERDLQEIRRRIEDLSQRLDRYQRDRTR